MGQITQIAFELRDMAQQELDDESSDVDLEEDNSEVQTNKLVKRQETGEWMRFCKEKIDKIEKIWKRKLEESSTGDDDSDGQSGDNKSQEGEDDNLSHEDTVNMILSQNVGGRFG